MIKKNKIQWIAFLLALDLIAAAGVTVQAASMQDLKDVEVVYMSDTENHHAADQVSNSFVSPISEEVLEVQKKAVEIQKKERFEEELLASIIFCEAGNQSYEGQVAVGAVVMNRIRSEGFPDSMEEVIYQPGQFVPATTGWLDRIRATSGYTETAMQAAKDAIKGVNPIGECLFFDQGGQGYQIGAHYFH